MPVVVLLIVIALLLAAPGAVRAQGPEVLTLGLPMSQAYLIRGTQPVLVDTGRASDCEALLQQLAAHGVAPAQLGLVVATHGHSDHAGCASALRSRGARIALGSGDAPMARAGHHGELTPTNITGWMLKTVAIDPRYPPFEPDVLIGADPLPLAPFGIAGRVLPLRGHTPGSLVVVLDDGRAIVGDLMLGGFFGGAFAPARAGRHYFHADEPANNANIRTLLGLGVQRFLLGHGGPVDRASVIEAFGAP